MPVFDFSDAPDAKNPGECTYTTFQSSEPEASPDKPILVLDNKKTEMAASFLRNVYESGKTYHLRIPGGGWNGKRRYFKN